MTSRYTCKSSSWIKFLRKYGPIPSNDNMYDEAIHRSLKRLKNVPPLKFESEHLGDLVDNFRSDNPKSVILTGTAGDGKTFYCRQIWQHLSNSSESWNSEKKIQSLNLGNTHLTVIKDLSELNDREKQDILIRAADAIVGASSDEVFLIAANDGQLVEAWSKAGKTGNIPSVLETVEHLLVMDKQEREGYKLLLFNLSRLSAAHTFPRILKAVMEHPGWSECNSCPYNNPAEVSQRCPIIENKRRLEGAENSIIKERLIDLLELAELNGYHIPVRQVLLLIANSILGHPDAKDKLIACEDIPKIISSERTSLASIYRNIFGENLSERKRESTDVFVILNRFSIGNETSNKIDNILIFGENDPQLGGYYEQLMLSDQYYGADNNFTKRQRAYLEGTSLEGEQEFLDLLKSQRQRLFFTLPESLTSDMKLWELTVFQYSGEFLEKLYRPLKRGERIDKHIIYRLVKGMNRIFTGMMVNNQDRLILATSGSYSQAKVSRVFEDFISVPKKSGESVTIELEPETSKPQLVVSLSSNENIPKVKLYLNLTRFEYLSRVAEGALPTSFSRECYEDILAFKTQLLKSLFRRRNIENEEEGTTDSIVLQLITDLDSDGMINNPHTIEVNTGVR